MSAARIEPWVQDLADAVAKASPFIKGTIAHDQYRLRQQQYQIARENIRTYQLEAIAMLTDISPTTPFADIENLSDIRKKLDDIEANLKLIAGEL